MCSSSSLLLCCFYNLATWFREQKYIKPLYGRLWTLNFMRSKRGESIQDRKRTCHTLSRNWPGNRSSVLLLYNQILFKFFSIFLNANYFVPKGWLPAQLTSYLKNLISITISLNSYILDIFLINNHLGPDYVCDNAQHSCVLQCLLTSIYPAELLPLE